MKKLLILYPHFPPSNLAGVHRPRLFANHLKDFGWDATVLTVHEDFYEEKLDWNLHKLLPADLRVEKVNAWPVTKPRLIGDIGLRGFLNLFKRAKTLIAEDNYDFLYIPVPSFYTALLGRLLNSSTGIKYGIDYIDPWVHQFPGSEKIFSRHWASTWVAKMLEPIAVKKASLIMGVAEGYYKDVYKRNPALISTTVSGAMPYGGEERDYHLLSSLEFKGCLFKPDPNKIQLVYAGAMLPKAYKPLEAIFKVISGNPKLFKDIEFHFIGTGSRATDAESYNIKELAEKYSIFGKVIFEYPARIAYADVLLHLAASTGIFILGSTEAHYTPSKVYQGVLSNKPIFAILHKESTAASVIESSNAGIVLTFNGEPDIESLEKNFISRFSHYLDFKNTFNPAQVNRTEFNKYSAKEVTRIFASLLNRALAV